MWNQPGTRRRPHLSSSTGDGGRGTKREIAGLGDLEIAGPTGSAPPRWTRQNRTDENPATTYASGAFSYTDTNGNAGGMEAEFADAYTADSAVMVTLVIPLPVQ